MNIEYLDVFVSGVSVKIAGEINRWSDRVLLVERY